MASELARRWELPKPRQKFNGLISEGRIRPGGPRVALLQPLTYMNESGNSAGPARGSLKAPLDRVIALHDEIDLPFGEIQAEVTLELEGAETAPGVKGGGVVEHVTREITVEALPTDIPDNIVVDVSAMEINDTLSLAVVSAPDGVTFVAEDHEEVTIVTLSPPRVEEVTTEVEEEAELVGEGEEGEAAEGEGGDDSGEGEGE